VHIILVSNRLATAKSIQLTLRHIVMLGAGFGMLVLLLATLIYYVTFRHAVDIKLPLLQDILMSLQQEEKQKSTDFMRENLNAMAVKVGQMQAQLMRLDALGERLSALSGIKPTEFRFNELPARGGAVSATPSVEMSATDFNHELEKMQKQLESRTDYLGMLENELLDTRIKKKLIPTVSPVDAGFNASSFGWRIDPFTGENAMHEGIDFMVGVGTPVFAAAGGVVTVSEFHPQYGNMIEIDHGNDFTTRYAHASKLLVKTGEVVKRGQEIAESGGTGRATGPHVHFEVRYKGVAQNPARFLAMHTPETAAPKAAALLK
jgi:murein DD-endopeptidase MepM/ murein hydrolase activator NlpD